MTAFAIPQATKTTGHLALTTEWLSPSEVHIRVAGEVDASNAGQLADYVFHRAANCLRLTLDLQKVEFFGTAGFTTLRTIDIRCAHAQVMWELRPSRAVARTLDICDPRRSLPVVAA